MTKKSLSNHFSKLSKSFSILIVFSLLIGFSGLATATHAEIKDIDVVDRVDNDGDGYISDFAVEISSTDTINEKGHPRTGKLKDVYDKFGEAWYGVYFPVKSYYDKPDMWKQEGYGGDVRLNFDYNSVKNINANSKYSAEYRQFLNGEKAVPSLKVQFLESDTDSGKSRLKDEVIEEQIYIFENGKQLLLESPENDREEAVSIKSDPSGAKVYVNGDGKGTTPWGTDMPVDIQDREGALNIRLEKDGYHTFTTKESVYPPEDLEYEMKKVKQPIVVDANVDSAEVFVNGQKIGETPVSQKFWVKQGVDIRVEKEGYEDQTFSNVKAPRQLKATFDTGSDSSSDLLFDPGLTEELNNQLIENLDLESFFHTDFNVSSKTVKTGEQVTFDASPSYDLGANISTYNWNLGDGSQSTGKVSSHTYSKPGNYTVNLSVINSNGNEDHAVTFIEVKNRFPVPKLSGSSNVKQNQAVTFDATGSTDPDGTITVYTWKIDGKTVAQNQNGEFTHIFQSSGNHEVSVMVTDDAGFKKTVKKTVNVQKPNLKPNPSFTVSKTNPEVNETVNFDASGSTDPDGTIQTVAWNFGDGMSKSGQKVSYRYRQPGNYTVELNVLDSGNLNAGVKKSITVEAVSGTQQSSNQESDQSSSSSSSTQQTQENKSANRTEEKPEEESGGVVQQIMNLLGSLF